MLYRWLPLLLGVMSAALAQETRVDFATYFGGRDADFGRAIAAGPGGDIWIAGITHSTNFPVVAPFQAQCVLGSLLSCYEGFLARLSADGRSVRFATFLGASSNDEITALAVDEQGYAYVTGTYRDGVLAARFDPNGRPVYAHSFGGPQITMGRALTIDPQGNLYITGRTSSPSSLPAVNAIYSTGGPISCMAIGGGGIPIDAFVMKLDPNGRVLFSTYIPGNGNDFGSAIAVDALSRIYIAGGTTSTNLPLPNAIQSNYAGGPPQPVGTCDPGDAFLLQIDPVAGRVLFGTLLGGAGTDNIEDVFVESGGIVTVTGTMRSGEVFAARIDPITPLLIHSRLLSVPSAVASMSRAGRLTMGTVRVNISDWRHTNLADLRAPISDAVEASDGSLLAIGSANALDTFTPHNALQSNNAGFHDAWIAKLTPVSNDRVTVVNAASFGGPEIAPGSLATLFGPMTGAEVRVQNRPARVIASSTGQINLVVPDEVSPGPAEIEVLEQGRQVASGSVLIHGVAPAIFTAEASGRGAPAAQLIRIGRDGTRTYQSPFVCDGGCRPAPIDASDEQTRSMLALYCTGIHNRASPDQVRAVIAGEEFPVEFAGVQGEFEGLDQVNVNLPAALRGRGEVDLVLRVESRLSNAVRLNIR